MPDQMSTQDLKERLRLIEGMIAEGRRSTGKWGWIFVLWGVAYYVAAAWAWTGSSFAWPVTMVAAAVLSSVLASRFTRGRAETTLGRAAAAPWIAMGISIMVVLICLGASGRYDQRVFIAITAAMLATANTTSAIILKWKAQYACAAVWLASAVVACFGSQTMIFMGFLTAIFLCQIAFGVYVMILESRQRHREIAHA